MKLALSYFYQIRHFKPYMIPVSTAMWDPTWFHRNNMTTIFKDKNNVYNGLRFEELMPGKNCNGLCRGIDNCKTKDPNNCEFLKAYRKQLKELNFDNLISKCNILANNIQRIGNFIEEPIIVFMVYEKVENACSERSIILSVFKEHGLDINELIYPIKDNY